MAKVGPPNKQQQIKNKIAKADESYTSGELKARILLGENYFKYLEVLHKIAMGELKGNQGSAARGLVDQTEKLFGEDKSEESTEDKDKNVEVNTQSLISLVANSD